MINLRHIEIFHAVYARGSVSAAARALNVSQPSVTKTLKHAEQLLGFALFERTGGRLVPTADAHTLFRDAAEIQDRVQSLRQASSNLRHGRGAMLRVAVLPSMGLDLVPGVVADFLATHQGVSFDLQTLHHDDMVRRLYERETDIVIGNQIPPAAPVAHRWLGEGELVLLYREADLPDAPARLPLTALQDAPFISPMLGGPFGHLLSGELLRMGVVPDEILSARTFYMAAALVRSGVGRTVVDNFTAHAMATPGLSFRPIQPAIAFDVQAIHLQDRPPSSLASAFLDRMAAAIVAL